MEHTHGFYASNHFHSGLLKETAESGREPRDTGGITRGRVV